MKQLLFSSEISLGNKKLSAQKLLSPIAKGSMITVLLCLLTLFFAGESNASKCLNGSCHTALGATKFLHGPVAAEKAGGQGCVACHVPNGPGCTKAKKGVYKILAPASLVCQICHTRGTGTQHSRKKIDCLQCHDPHGSDKNSTLNR